ncbi:MAG: class I SAM-dependent methyltransferase [Gaiellaceae bacterium]
MTQFHFDPGTYPQEIRGDIPAYDELQEQVAQAAAGLDVHEVLELGTGTGETAERILGLYPEARLVGIDASAHMLAAARARLGSRPLLLVARLEDPLPPGPYELVVSALAVHHLDGEGKRDLFRRVARVLRPGGRFVLADVIVPEDPAQAVIPLTPDYDRPDTLADQLAWLAEAGFDARARWQLRDLAVVSAERTPPAPDGRDGAHAERPPTSP